MPENVATFSEQGVDRRPFNFKTCGPIVPLPPLQSASLLEVPRASSGQWPPLNHSQWAAVVLIDPKAKVLTQAVVRELIFLSRTSSPSETEQELMACLSRQCPSSVKKCELLISDSLFLLLFAEVEAPSFSWVDQALKAKAAFVVTNPSSSSPLFLQVLAVGVIPVLVVEDDGDSATGSNWFRSENSMTVGSLLNSTGFVASPATISHAISLILSMDDVEADARRRQLRHIRSSFFTVDGVMGHIAKFFFASGEGSELNCIYRPATCSLDPLPEDVEAQAQIKAQIDRSSVGVSCRSREIDPVLRSDIKRYGHRRKVDPLLQSLDYEEMGEGNCVSVKRVISHGWQAFIEKGNGSERSNRNSSPDSSEEVSHSNNHEAGTATGGYYRALRPRCRIVQFITSGHCELWRNFMVSARAVGVEDLLVVFALDHRSAQCIKTEQQPASLYPTTNTAGRSAGSFLVPELDSTLIHNDSYYFGRHGGSTSSSSSEASSETSETAAPFGTFGFRRITELKFTAIASVLSKGFFVLFLDADLVLTQDPLEAIINVGQGPAAAGQAAGRERGSKTRSSSSPRELWVQSDRPDFWSGVDADEADLEAHPSMDGWEFKSWRAGRSVCSGVMLWAPTCTAIRFASYRMAGAY
jgi:hypothetical protein